MDGVDRRGDSEGRFSHLSEGQRYALALVLNLTFVGVVIGAFALLYTSGLSDDDSGSGATSAAVREELVREEELTGPRAASAPDPEPSIAVAALDPPAAPADPRLADPLAGPAAGAPSASDAGPFEEPGGAFPPVEPLADVAARVAADAQQAGADPAAADPAFDAADSADAPADPAVLASAAAPEAFAAEDVAADDPAADAVAPDDEVQTAALDTAADAAGAEEQPDDAAGAEVIAAAAAAAAEDAGPGASALAPRLRIDPTASLWVAAGELASTLQTQFPCSQFALQPGSSGRPALQARVGPSDNIDAVRQLADTGFAEDDVDIRPGVGCTSVLGGGYVALTDEQGRIVSLGAPALTGELAAALPRDSACPAMGQVIDTDPTLRDRVMIGGRAAAWVRANGDVALCEEDYAGGWNVVDGLELAGRSAAALLLGDDVVAAEVRRAANPAAPPPSSVGSSVGSSGVGSGVSSGAAFPPDPGASTQVAAALAPPTGPDGEVAPLSGPTPALPVGVARSSDGYTVVVGFTVDPQGRAHGLSVLDSGMAPTPVVAQALSVVSASTFPGRPDAYRARHTVRFPAAEFASLLQRLTTSVATPTSSDGLVAPAAASAGSPVWDRSPSAADYARVYPDRALDRGIEGVAILDCVIDQAGRLECAIEDENPTGWGFGAAARQLADVMRASPRLSNGVLAANHEISLEFEFAVAE